LINDPDMPKKAGIYWASTDAFQWFNLIVDVYGDPPFLAMQAYNFVTGQACLPKPFEIAKWGPKIERPDKPKGEQV